MSQLPRTTRLVRDAINQLVESGTSQFRPGHVASWLREHNQPLGVWQIRAEFTRLAETGHIAVDEDTGIWHRLEQGASVAAG